MEKIILGIDPGTNHTGYGVIRVIGPKIECLDYGTLSPSPKCNLSEKILFIFQGLQSLCDKHQPHHLAIEKPFIGKNPDSAFKIGHIFALCLLESERRKIEFFEYSARFVKKSVTFSGGASKDLVKQFIMNFFSLKEEGIKKIDATDALAVALCHSRDYQKQQVYKRIERAL